MRVLFAFVRAGMVLAAVALLFLLVPGPRVSSASVELVLEVRPGAERVLPLEMARHIREVILDRTTIQRLAGESGADGTDRARIDAAARVERGVELVTLDGRVFHVIVRDTDGERATRVANELAELAVARAADFAARLCSGPGCSAKGRVAEGASLISVPLEPERWLALGLGLLLALSVAVVPLAVSSPPEAARRSEEDESPAEETPPPTDRLLAAARPMARTSPLEPAAPGATARGAGAVLFARTELASTLPPVRPEPKSAPPPPAPSPPSPIMGYGAPQGWHADPNVKPSARSELAAELTALSSEECLIVAVSATPQRGDLKAQVAIELALALSKLEDRRLLLLDADFRHPAVALMLHLEVPETVDFTRELARRVEGAEASPLGVLLCTPTFHVLPSQASPSGDFVLTTHFETCLRMIRDYYDLVVVHAPLTSAGVYCTAIADVVDGLILACDEGVQPPAAFMKKRLVRTVRA